MIATGLDNSSIVGENLTVVMENVGHPVTVNTVDREMFHYSLDTHSLRRTTLDTSISKVGCVQILNRWSVFSVINK